MFHTSYWVALRKLSSTLGTVDKDRAAPDNFCFFDVNAISLFRAQSVHCSIVRSAVNDGRPIGRDNLQPGDTSVLPVLQDFSINDVTLLRCGLPIATNETHVASRTRLWLQQECQ
jgi:hypothetical protein